MNKNQQLLAKIGGGSFVLLSFLAVGPQAQAITFVSNLVETTTAVSGFNFNSYQGSSFTTGNSTYTLGSISALLQEDTNSPNFFFRLYSDNSGLPDSILTSFTPTASISTSLAVNSFTPNSAVQLAANTTYWLVGGVSANDGSYNWGYTTSFNQTGIGGWTIGDGFVFSSNQGGSWDANPTDGPYQFSVDATDVGATTPEPSSLVALLGLGGLALGSRLKKRL